jgi:hypothetical protein
MVSIRTKRKIEIKEDLDFALEKAKPVIISEAAIHERSISLRI